MNFQLDNKVALVTGGSKNIGKEIALSLASKKVNIAFTYNSSETEAKETLTEIKKLGDELQNSNSVDSGNSKIAIIFDYDADAAWNIQPHGLNLNYFKLSSFYQ